MYKIGIDTRLTYYRTGGISTYMRRLVAALEQLDSRNHYTIFQSRKSTEVITRQFAHTPLWTPCHHRLERIALSVELARFRLDVFHSPDFIPPLRGARQHIITVHDLTFLHYPQFVTPDSRRYYNDQIEKAVQQAAHILTDSEASKNDMIALLGVPADKITVHMLGVDERFVPFNAADRIAALGLPAEYVLFVGTLEPRKNLPGLLAAYRKLLERLPAAPPMLLVGKKGWYFAELQAQINALHLGDRLIWREDIGDSDLPAVYNQASLLALPSFYEGFGFPALEAMACGTVPVVSNRSSLPEVVGAVGAQVDPDDHDGWAAAMERVLLDDSWRLEQRRAGLERARQFTWEQTAQLALGIYEQVGNTG